MRTFSLSALALLIPGIAFAISIPTDNPDYSDVPGGTPEAVAIAALSEEGVVEGYADGTFRPDQLLNRAEFLKIVLESNPDLLVLDEDSANCFPDVQTSDWFSKYVCFAEFVRIVGGYPDGQFRPANYVNYAEALKILANIYGYPITSDESQPWYQPYYVSAVEHGTALPFTLNMDAQLTRGQMARLAAAFRAEHDGMLEEYRDAEEGIVRSSSSSSVSSPSSSSSSSSDSSSSESSQSSSSSSSSSSSDTSLLPATQSFMVVGEFSKPLADGVIVRNGEDAEIRFIRVLLDQEVNAVEFMELRTADDELIAVLERRTINNFDNYKQMYEATFNGSGYVLHDGEDLHVYTRAKIRDIDNNGASNQLLLVKEIRIDSYGADTNQTVNHVIRNAFPKHQTSFGRITDVKNVGQTSGTLVSGNDQKIGSFHFDAEHLPSKPITINELTFTITKLPGVSVSNWRLENDDGLSQSCFVGSNEVNCLNVQQTFGSLSSEGKTLHLVGNVSLSPSESGRLLKVSLVEPGSTSERGSIIWSDGTGDFQWVGLPSPVVEGTEWR